MTGIEDINSSCYGTFFQSKSIDIFLISPRMHMLWYYLEVPEALLMNTHNICFRGEIRKILT